LDYLSLTDLFIVGLGLDITGAILLAKGLLISPATLRRPRAWNYPSSIFSRFTYF
jgi:hypothetical protein